jgi:hypothetical protein
MENQLKKLEVKLETKLWRGDRPGIKISGWINFSWPVIPRR